MKQMHISDFFLSVAKSKSWKTKQVMGKTWLAELV